MKKSRKALLTSALSLLLCFSMLLGTTYAWFTDSVESTNNIIQAGNLDVELEYWDKDAKKWESVGGGTPLFEENTLWEPGYTQVVYLRAANKGTLALKYQLGINIAEEKSGTRVDENGQEVSFKLSDSIYMGVKEGVNGETAPYATREAAVDAVKDASGIISKGFNKYGDMNANAPEQYLALVVYMPESVGNEANHKTGTEAPKIKLGIKLYATQKTNEEDSFGSDYDAAAKHPYGDVNYTAAKEIPDEKISTDPATSERKLTEAVTVGNESDGIYAEVPDGVKLADGATALELTVQAMDESASEADVTLESGESKQSLNIHIDGVAEDNATPMLITLEGLFKPGLNSTSVAMYHVENGVTVPMTMVANPTDHNEFSYDPATGNVVLCVKSFSEYTAVTDNKNLWKGNFDTTWYNDTDTEFTLTTADQLAGFGAIVDGGYTKPDGTVVTLTADTFEGKTVKLGADIDLSGGYSLNPIGCGYAPETGVTNSKDANGNPVPGYAFKGTFDGQNHTIYNLYQNGWELGLSYCNLGGGLFASVAGTTEKPATIKNLTISGANIVMECVEMGVLVGLSQGNCTYENINIYNSKIANYQRATGGLIGEVSGDGTTTINTVTIGSDVVVGSLWGDFDCPVGGVIGARWDNADKDPQIVMNNVTVACRLDVYNDVTSSYQWYAYRRAGMLIGNTDTPPANGKDSATATADFLTCVENDDGTNTVTVYYSPWIHYTYCEFTTEHNTGRNWPWVRVQAGENCSAYSNPRYGHPGDKNGNLVTGDHEFDAVHVDGEGHEVEITFNQLYGGGQGVYGAAEHQNKTGVSDGNDVDIVQYLYTITYKDNDEVLHVDYVEKNTNEYTDLWTYSVAGKTFDYWENAYSQEISKIPANNTNNYVLYPKWKGEYVVRFLTADETVVGWAAFTTDGTKPVSAPDVPDIGEGFVGYWETKDGVKWEDWTTANVENDVLFYAHYDSKSLSLVPIYDANGIQIAYGLNGITDTSSVKVEIPDYVNGYPVTTVYGGALSQFSAMETVYIPLTVTEIGADAFADEEKQSGLGGFLGLLKYEQITFLYEGSYEDWGKITRDANWDQYIGDGSKIYFVADGTYSEKTGTNGINAKWGDPVEGTYTPSTT